MATTSLTVEPRETSALDRVLRVCATAAIEPMVCRGGRVSAGLIPGTPHRSARSSTGDDQQMDMARAHIPQRSVGAVALLVPDYQDAIDYFVDTLGFALVEDTGLSKEKRWVLVSPGSGTSLLLAKAKGERQRAAIGNQSGGRVFLFLETDDFWRDYRAYRSRGVEFQEEPRHEEYGTVAVFTDRYGNRWDLIERSSS